jgi:transglutaminase-like putative cysteine protease
VKKSNILLFSLRLFFYASVVILPILHPGITVSYDRIGIIQWFVIVPFEALAAFIPAPSKPGGIGGRSVSKIIIALLPLLIFSVWAGGLGLEALVSFGVGFLAFALTLLLFRYPRWGKLSAAEPFLLAWVCVRLLAFSRSGEEVSGQSLGLTQFILVWAAVVFLLHSAVVYFCLFPAGRGGAKGEAVVFGALTAALLFALVFVLPPDFARNNIIVNLLQDKIEGKSKPSDTDFGLPDKPGGRRNGRGTLPGSKDGQQPGLRGLSEHDWPGEGGKGTKGKQGKGGGEGGEQRQQYTVMVVASKEEPVYMGSAFRGKLDPIQGFLPSPDEPLNNLPHQRLFVTWYDHSPSFDQGRQRLEVFSLSTLPQNFLPWRPRELEPTVLNENSGPLRYMHRTLSDFHTGDPLELANLPVRELNDIEESALAPYLEINLEESDRAVFDDYLASALKKWRITREANRPELQAPAAPNGTDSCMEKILAILTGFSDYQYNVSDNDNYSIASLKDFILTTKDGDCVEFSNTAALLARLAGIPSRVVTGYLAAESLQTQAHLRGLAALRNKIPVLQQFPFEDLYLVTDAHSHSWPQFYIAGYGWLDFESTAFAIPPLGMGDGNMRDVVIPLLDENKIFSPVRAFPWKAVLRAAGFLALLVLLCAYITRYIRELALYTGSRRGGRKGARSLYLLLLARLAAEGRPIKPASKTAAEYTLLFPAPEDEGRDAMRSFAAIYSELRWREFSNATEAQARFAGLKASYRKILAAQKRRGPVGFVMRIFSLRGLAYL